MICAYNYNKCTILHAICEFNCFTLKQSARELGLLLLALSYWPFMETVLGSKNNIFDLVVTYF
jgi:hypothetical protein